MSIAVTTAGPVSGVSPARECERTARAQGLAAGLALALRGCDAMALAPGRYAAVPAGGVPADVPLAAHDLAAAEGIVFADRGQPRARDDGGGQDGGGGRQDDGGGQDGGGGRPEASLAELGQRLAGARLGLTRRLLDAAVEHLSARSAGDEPLVRKQLVTGTIADVIAGIELLREYAACLPGPDAPLAAIADLHARITDTDTEVIRLFGAAGYLADHPVRALYVSALVASTWITEGAGQ